MMLTRVVSILVIAFIGTEIASAEGAVRTLWAVNDGEKVKRDDRQHPTRAGNSVWDGRRVRLFGARNEIVAVQVIVEADGLGITRLTLALPDLRAASGDRITYRPPALDPTDSVDRPIQIFAEHYMHVTMPSHASWVYTRGSAAAPRDPTGWKPVQLVPEHARSERGGLPIGVRPNENQAIWIEIYTGRDRPAGLYRGTIEINADGRTHRLPIELELFDFALPDENSIHAMVYYESSQPERYHGRNLDAAYHRLAHRYRIELVHAYDERSVEAAAGRFSGEDFTRSHGYQGPGERVGNVIAPISFYGPGDAFDDRPQAWQRADAWMTFLRARLPRALTFLYMPDEPRPPQYPRILTLAANVHSNPGPGRTLPVFVTSEYVAALDPAIDIWCAGPKGFDVARAAQGRARGRQFWVYNGGRPAGGAIVIDAPATDARALIWAAFKHDVPVYFYWHAVHWRHNSQKQGERDQNVWADSITFDNRKQPNKPIDDQGYIHGDGVLLYPGEEKLHPDEDRGLPGPVATIQLANLRRGLQDHQYLTLARRLGLTAEIDAALRAIVPRVFSEAGPSVSFPETGDAYEKMRLSLARAIVAAQSRTPRLAITAPIMFDTPEADRVLSTLQVFPPDNPWNENIADRPVAPTSDAIVRSIGRDQPLGFNLDMNFVIVPPNQPRVPVRVLLYPEESDSGPFPIPDTAPIENWPLRHNEDAGALPRPGMTLAQFQREGSGDRHLIVVDPFNGRLHEFWQARRTDQGWQASQASTFDLTSNRLRPERWTSADAAGLPIFPAVVRYDDVARGLVRHAMRVTVRRTRREYAYPARHFASRETDASLPRMGERLRLRRDFDVSGFPPHAQAILRGLQTYGMLVADNGADWLLSIAPDRRIHGLDSLARVKGSDFEVVVPIGPARAADEVRVATGTLEGIAARAPGIRAFLGIPYAAPPIGARRWKAPEAAAPWTGVRKADTFGNRCVQTTPFPDMIFQSAAESEDCLYLSIWTPAKTSAERLPVMVWIHGGGFFSGASDEHRHDGTALASKGVVVVELNYRLGILGFLAHPALSAESDHHASGNYGLLDQVAALRWVHENIAAFGGDPAQVTIFGESAGSFSVSALMASPLTDGLFARAIGESGAYFSSTTLPLTRLAAAEKRGADLAARVGAASIADLRAMPAAQIIRAAGAEARSYAPIIDGYLLADDPWTVFAEGKQRRVPLLAGWNSAELKPPPTTAEAFKAQLKSRFPSDEAAALAAYPAGSDGEASLSAVALASDSFIGYNTWKWIEAHAATGQSPVYRYLFDQILPTANGAPAANNPGAAHATDIEFVFNTLDSRKLAWRADDRRVADMMGSYWTNFAKTGNPNGAGLPAWPAWKAGGGGQLLRINANARAEDDTHRSRYEFQDAVERNRRGK